MKLRFTLLFICSFLMHASWAQKGVFLGFTYNSSTKILPFTTIRCEELPDLDEQSDQNGYFELMLDTGTYHFHFFFGNGKMHQGLTAINEPVKIEENIATILSIKLEGQMRSAINKKYLFYEQESYYKSIPRLQELLGIDFDSLKQTCPETIDYENHSYSIVNAQIIGDKSRRLAIDLNLPDTNHPSPFGERAECMIQFEKWGASRDFYSELPTYALHNGVLVQRFLFDRISDLKGVKINIYIGFRPNDSTKRTKIWTNPNDYLWLQKTLVIPGMNSTKQFAYDEANRIMKIDSLCKCPESGRGAYEKILAEEYGIPVFNPKSVYNWKDFSPIFCPIMDSLIKIRLGDEIFHDISYQVFQNDSIAKRKERTAYPKYPGGDSLLIQYFEKNLNLDSNACGPLKNILLSVKFNVDEKGKTTYLSSKFDQLYQYSEKNFKNYDSLNCQFFQEEVQRLIPKMKDWIPAQDGFKENTSMETNLNLVFRYNGTFSIST